MNLFIIASLSTLAIATAIPNVSNSSDSTPTVSLANGTYYGNFIESFNQDAFLGIPYAQPPLGSLRFMPPQSLNDTFDSPRSAVEYGDVCIGLGLFGDNKGLPESEDCLTLNVVKPHGDYTDLPVAIWIHGGGFYDGSSRRDVYNLSYIVENSVEIGKPMIAVSINYRLAALGNLASLEVGEVGATNVALRDQLKAIEWVHENIAEFGGNPGHIVIWGESAGSISVSLLLGTSNLGDYVVGGIMESGSAQSTRFVVTGDEANQEAFNNLTEALSCSYDDVDNPFDCLQTVNITDFKTAIKDTDIVGSGYLTTPYIDGDVVKRSATLRLKSGDFAKVPIIIGTNTDEGTAFVSNTTNTDEDIITGLQATFPLLKNSSTEQILKEYPRGNKLFECPYDSHKNVSLPSGIGSEFPRFASIYGDISFIGPRRSAAKAFAAAGVPVYSYRWNVADKGAEPYNGASHFQEVVYVFDNPSQKFVTASPWNEDASSPALADMISKQWCSFIADLTPNNHNLTDVPVWPEYDAENGQNFVFELDGKSYIEEDSFRAEAISYVMGNIYNQFQH